METFSLPQALKHSGSLVTEEVAGRLCGNAYVPMSVFARILRRGAAGGARARDRRLAPDSARRRRQQNLNEKERLSQWLMRCGGAASCVIIPR